MLVDLHLHTRPLSPCSSMTPDELMAAAKQVGLQAVCLTEHDSLWPLEDVRTLAARHDLRVFRGMELTTTGGDVVVFGLEEAPREMLTPSELKAKVDAAGGIAIAAHPFRGFLLFGYGALKLDLGDAIQNPLFLNVDGLEICNGLVTEDENRMALRVAEELGLLKLAGSDAHSTDKVGLCATRFFGAIEAEADLIKAIRENKFSVERLG